MKRRSAKPQRGGTSPYAKYGKSPYKYPEWVLDRRKPIPADIRQQCATPRRMLSRGEAE